MLDLTPHVKLNRKQNYVYIFLRLFLVFLFIFLIYILAKNFIFPTKTFYFNNAVRSLANTISQPYETKDGTSFHIATEGEFDQISISMTLQKNTPTLPTHTTSSIKKSYLAFLAPISTQKYTNHIVKAFVNDDVFYIEKNAIIHPLISKNAFDSYLFKRAPDETVIDAITNDTISKDVIAFAPATLISSKEGVFVTDGTDMHPVQDERTFKVLGYNFDNVIKTNSEERSYYKKSKMLSISSTHPFGTIFYTNDSNRAFIFDHNTLNKISVTKNVKNHAIIVQEASRKITSPCTFEKTAFSDKYTCTTSLENIEKFNGNTYRITLDNMPNTKIDTIQIKLFTKINKKSFEERLHALRRKFTTIYN
ncbi:MAG: hypothetical protein CR972_04960 [Candidatus Moraniibacteriota bacterium]|nr:MAG: hypothetical protein CR972_04960 [Candidatus Moranbacteria bacterium]